MPYLHGLSRNLKNLSIRCGTSWCSSALANLKDCVLAQVRERRRECQVNHSTRFVHCKTRVVYEVPLTCGRSYIRQTGRCINTRLREHRNSLCVSSSRNLVVHCSRCPHSQMFSDTRIWERRTGRFEREMLEVVFRRETEETCISVLSLSIAYNKVTFLLSHYRQVPQAIPNCNVTLPGTYPWCVLCFSFTF